MSQAARKKAFPGWGVVRVEPKLLPNSSIGNPIIGRHETDELIQLYAEDFLWFDPLKTLDCKKSVVISNIIPVTKLSSLQPVFSFCISRPARRERIRKIKSQDIFTVFRKYQCVSRLSSRLIILSYPPAIQRPGLPVYTRSFRTGNQPADNK